MNAHAIAPFPVLALAALSPLLCAAGPVIEGAELELVAGGGTVRYDPFCISMFGGHDPSCDKSEHEELTVRAGLQYRHRMLRLGLDLSVSEISGRAADGDSVSGFAYVGATVGIQGAYAGLELGPAVVKWGPLWHRVSPWLDASIWAGVPDAVYWWIAIAPPSGAYAGLGTGLGHRSERVRVLVGAGLSALGLEPVLQADLRLRAHERWWLGGELVVGIEGTWRASLGITLSLPRGSSGA
jgi:hypothetical protein